MKKLISFLVSSLIAASALLVPVAIVGTGTAAAVTHPSYCTGTDAWSVNYKAKFQYPMGTYWQHQIHSSAWNAAYYASHNAQYLATYGC